MASAVTIAVTIEKDYEYSQKVLVDAFLIEFHSQIFHAFFIVKQKAARR